VAYSDVFDYPLNVHGIHRYLVRVQASRADIEDALRNGPLVPQWLCSQRGFYFLPGREFTVGTRLRRAETARRLWPKALRYGRAIASLPFVRMVAVTGTLAMNNVDPGADIDYLLVTVSQRLWLARSLSIAMVYTGRLERVTICPNYVLSVDALEQFEHSLFVAHELAQMVPLYGLDTYRTLIQANGWAREHLPNAFGADLGPPSARTAPVSKALKRGMEVVLGRGLGDMWERREGQAKIQELCAQAATSGTGGATFTFEACKGHMEDHGARIAEAFSQRLDRLGLNAEDLLNMRQPEP
jgi:hypothetical protein